MIHGAIGEFTETYAKALPADPLAALLALGEKHFAPLQDYPEARAFWWPRFVRIARWFVAWEAERRANATAMHAEVRGELDIEIDKRVFKLTTRADRIEQLRDGTLRDPRLQDRRDADREAGAHRARRRSSRSKARSCAPANSRTCRPGSLSEFTYVSLRGRDPAGEEKPIEFKDGTPDESCRQGAGEARRASSRASRTTQTPYRSLVSPMWKTRYGDYDHLARVQEWSAGGEDEEGVE